MPQAARQSHSCFRPLGNACTRARRASRFVSCGRPSVARSAGRIRSREGRGSSVEGCPWNKGRVAQSRCAGSEKVQSKAENSMPARNFSKHFPRIRVCRRTRMVSVRHALALLLSQCAWLVRAALWRCRTEPRRAAFPKGRAESENGSRRDLKGRGAPGGWKGVQEWKRSFP